jgi:hypothetical protein
MAYKVAARQPFYHSRWNDGEARAMTLPGESQANCDGHRYFADMGEALKRTFVEILDYANVSSNILVGTMLDTDPEHPTCDILRDVADDASSNLHDVRFTVGEFWLRETGPAPVGMCALLDALHESKRMTVLIGNNAIRPARHCMGAEFVAVPAVDAWLHRDRIERTCKDVGDYATFVWCCGFVGKVVSWEIFKEFPNTTHIDAGHTFDGVFGNLSREWMRRGDSEQWVHYRDVFGPYVKGFIP